MEKEKAFKILDNLTNNGLWTVSLSKKDYGYIENEKDVVCFSYSSSIDKQDKRFEEVFDKLAEDLFNNGKEYQRFIMVMEYNANEPRMSEMQLFFEFSTKYIKEKKLSWGMARHNDIEGLRITLIASR